MIPVTPLASHSFQDELSFPAPRYAEHNKEAEVAHRDDDQRCHSPHFNVPRGGPQGFCERIKENVV